MEEVRNAYRSLAIGTKLKATTLGFGTGIELMVMCKMF
jgi:hypothetical protein